MITLILIIWGVAALATLVLFFIVEAMFRRQWASEWPSERGYVGNRSGWYPRRPRGWHA